jgi:hypothetical protein
MRQTRATAPPAFRGPAANADFLTVFRDAPEIAAMQQN